MRRSIVYFEELGKGNTAATLKLACQRATELGIKRVVVSSSYGFTARRALVEFAGTGITLVVIGHFREEFDAALAEQLKGEGHQVLFTGEIGSPWPEIVSNAFRKLCEGLKVIMQITTAAVDAGALTEGERIVAIAGTGPVAFPAGGGADTAVVMIAGPSSEHAADYRPPPKPERRRVREIICMPG